MNSSVCALLASALSLAGALSPLTCTGDWDESTWAAHPFGFLYPGALGCLHTFPHKRSHRPLPQRQLFWMAAVHLPVTADQPPCVPVVVQSLQGLLRQARVTSFTWVTTPPCGAR